MTSPLPSGAELRDSKAKEAELDQLLKKAVAEAGQDEKKVAPVTSEDKATDKADAVTSMSVDPEPSIDVTRSELTS